MFGLLVAAAGCLRGIRSGRDAAAVGAATTSAVVSGIVVVIVADCLINVVCYALGVVTSPCRSASRPPHITSRA